MDVFNHGQWNFQFGNYSIEFGLPSASASQAATTLGQPDPKSIESIGTFDSLGSSLKVLFGIPTPLAPLFSRPLFARFAPSFRRSFAVAILLV